MVSSSEICLRKKASNSGDIVVMKGTLFSPSSSAQMLMLDACRLSFVPLIAPSTTDERIRYLSTIADSFIYASLKHTLTLSICPADFEL